MNDKCVDTIHEINTCYLKYGEVALLYGKCAHCKRSPKEIIQQETIEALEWMVTQLKWQHDNERDALQDEGSVGGYSPKLTKAINLLNRLKE